MATFPLLHLPFVVWWARRLADRSDDALCGLSLLLFLSTVNWRTIGEQVAEKEQLKWILVHLGLTLLVPFTPPLVWGTLAATAWVFCFDPAVNRMGGWLLLLAALPTGPSFQFYLGYPFRRVAAELASLWWRLGGSPIHAEGVLLRSSSGFEVAVDVPCAGLHSLWIAQVFIGYVFAIRPGSPVRQCGLGLVALFAVLLANGVRSALLFGFLSDNWPTWPGFHEQVGLAVFALWFVPWLLAVRHWGGPSHV